MCICRCLLETFVIFSISSNFSVVSVILLVDFIKVGVLPDLESWGI